MNIPCLMFSSIWLFLLSGLYRLSITEITWNAVSCLSSVVRTMAFRAILVFLPTLLGIALSQSPNQSFYGNSLSFMSPQKKKDGTVQVGFGINQCPTRLWEAKQNELFATLTNRQMAKLTMYCMYNRSNSNSYTVCFTTNYWNRYMYMYMIYVYII